METKFKRSTVYIDAKLHRALKIKSAEVERTISALINEAISQVLAEDYEDLKAFEDRKNDSSLDFETVLKELKSSGKL